MFLGAPTGSGKSICLLLAVLRLFREDDRLAQQKKNHIRGKVVYIAPYESVVKQVEREWRDLLRPF